MKTQSVVAPLVLSVALAVCASKVVAQPKFPEFRQTGTLAGSGTAGAKDGAAREAQLNRPHGINLMVDGTVVFADRGNHQIRVARLDGTVRTVAGTGTSGFADGPGGTASFNEPIAVVVDRAGTIYVADRNNHRIRMITAAGAVTTLAGDGQPGNVDGAATSARFNQPYGVALDAVETTLYVADYLNHAVRRIDLRSKQVSTLAGNGTAGNMDGDGGSARFNQPYNVRIDARGMLWIPDQSNHSIRLVTPTGRVTTLAGSGKEGFADGKGNAAQFNNPTGIVAMPDGSAVVADRNSHRLRRVTADGTVTTLAGSGEAAFADGSTAAARFNRPLDVAFDAERQRLLVSEENNHRIRVLTP